MDSFHSQYLSSCFHILCVNTDLEVLSIVHVLNDATLHKPRSDIHTAELKTIRERLRVRLNWAFY